MGLDESWKTVRFRFIATADVSAAELEFAAATQEGFEVADLRLEKVVRSTAADSSLPDHSMIPGAAWSDMAIALWLGLILIAAASLATNVAVRRRLFALAVLVGIGLAVGLQPPSAESAADSGVALAWLFLPLFPLLMLNAARKRLPSWAAMLWPVCGWFALANSWPRLSPEGVPWSRAVVFVSAAGLAFVAPQAAATDSARITPAAFVRLSSWLAIAGAILELLLRALRLAMLGQAEVAASCGHDLFRLLPKDAFWLIPTSQLLSTACFAGALALFAVLNPRRSLPRVMFGLPLAMVGYGSARAALVDAPLVQFVVTLLFIVAGLRMLVQHADRFDRWSRQTLGPAIGVALAGSLLLGAWRPAVRSMPRAVSEADATNVLVLTLDNIVARDLLRGLPDGVAAPRWEELAARGTLFAHAITASAHAETAFLGLFTGCAPAELPQAGIVPRKNGPSTLVTVLTDRGYDVRSISADAVDQMTDIRLGFQRRDATGFWLRACYASSMGRLLAIPLAESIGLGAADFSGLFLDGLSGAEDSPWLAWVHQSVSAPRYLESTSPALRDSAPPAPAPASALTASQSAERLSEIKYRAAITRADAELGSIVDDLERNGRLYNTLIIVASCRGTPINHPATSNAGDGLRAAIEVPLLFVWPQRIPAGKVIDRPVSLLDVAATVLDLLEFDRQAPPLPGHSLVPLWSTDPPPGNIATTPACTDLRAPPRRTAGASEAGPVFSLVADGWHYVWRTSDDHEDLFDFARDPSESSNLAQREEFRQPLESLRRKLRLWLVRPDAG